MTKEEIIKQEYLNIVSKIEKQMVDDINGQKEVNLLKVTAVVIKTWQDNLPKRFIPASTINVFAREDSTVKDFKKNEDYPYFYGSPYDLIVYKLFKGMEDQLYLKVQNFARSVNINNPLNAIAEKIRFVFDSNILIKEEIIKRQSASLFQKYQTENVYTIVESYSTSIINDDYSFPIYEMSDDELDCLDYVLSERIRDLSVNKPRDWDSLSKCWDLLGEIRNIMEKRINKVKVKVK